MLSTIVPKTDQLNADSLIGGPITIKINKINLATGDQPVTLGYEGDNGKPFKPCKSMRRVLVQLWGSDGNAYVGRSLTLYCDIKVTFGGAAVGGIRISHMSDIKEPVTMLLTASKANKKPFTVKPLASSAPAAPATPPDQAVVDAGNIAAMKGVAAYTAWLGTLTPEVKTVVRHLHKGWSEAAKMADAPPPETVGDVLDALPQE